MRHPLTSHSYSNHTKSSIGDEEEADDYYGSSVDIDSHSAPDSDRSAKEETLEEEVTVVEQEARRLSEVIEACIGGGLSSRNIEKVLKARPLSCRCSYQSIKRWVKERVGIEQVRHPVCPDGHMAITGSNGSSESGKCAVEDCRERPATGVGFWRLPLIDQLQALAKGRESFSQLMRGQKRVKISLQAPAPSTYNDYYDGNLFRRVHGYIMQRAATNDELVIHLKISTDGFKMFEGRRKQRSSWPVAFTVLNYDHKLRFQAKSCLITLFIPGSHDSNHFDTFLRPTVKEILRLERGVMTDCADGKSRVMRGFVVFATGDMPAVSKCLGYAGHNSTRPCRFCHFAASYDSYCKTTCCIPRDGEECMRSSGEMKKLWEEV